MTTDSKDETEHLDTENCATVSDIDENKPENQEKSDFNDSAPSTDSLLTLAKSLVENLNRKTDPAMEPSPIERLKQMEENWGMHISDASFQNSTLIINHHGTDGQGKTEEEKNLLLYSDNSQFLQWCFKHYKDFYFSFLLSICILDRLPGSEILDMAREIKEIFGTQPLGGDNAGSETPPIYKTQLIEILGITEYTDFIRVRGEQLEVDFLRLPAHDQADLYIRLLIKEFPELKYMLSDYLFHKIMAVYQSERDFMLISGCFDAMTSIGTEDLQFFNSHIIPMFLKEHRVSTDYCLALLLKRMYVAERNRKVVIRCITQWGQQIDNPHCTLISLHLCGLIGGQENISESIWNQILKAITDEEDKTTAVRKTNYTAMLSGFFDCGNRNISYHKGVIHAFFHRISNAEKDHNRNDFNTLCIIFLLFLISDYNNCNLACGKRKYRDMIWIRLFEKLDEKTGKELSYLWAACLGNRQCQNDGWKILESYLSQYTTYDKSVVDRLSFFFYWVNQGMEYDKAFKFLMDCSSRHKRPVKIAADIYKRLEMKTNYE